MSTEEKAIVETKAGKIKGYYQQGLYIFKGVPFAAPPTGERRWLRPEPHEPWKGILETQAFGAIAPQNRRKPEDMKISGFGADEPCDEDCLYLNIWTLGLDSRARPVMVWIYGGGFNIGAGSEPLYRGDILASRGDVVVITINYRVGLLGFLNLNEITGGKIPSTGNEGLFDQIAALQWVRDNISAFGGDPNNVTVFGESAGGISIGCLLAMPEADGMFHRAILESGTGRMARPLDFCVDMSRQFLEVAGLESGDIEAIRSLSVERLLEIQQELTLRTRGVPPVAPVIDGKTMPEKPIDAARSGSAIKVPILVGSNLEEHKLATAGNPEIINMDEAALVRACQSMVPEKYVSQLIETYKDARARRGEPISPYDILVALKTDIMTRIPSMQTVEAYCNNGQAAYSYVFTWKSPAFGGLLGSCHALEIGFVFGTYDDTFCGSGPEADKLSATIQDAWVAFARNGNPSCKSLGDWPQYCDNRKTMMLGRECYVEEAFYEEERRMWDIIGDTQAVI